MEFFCATFGCGGDVANFNLLEARGRRLEARRRFRKYFPLSILVSSLLPLASKCKFTSSKLISVFSVKHA